MNAETSAPAYLSWPRREGYDFPALRAAELRAREVLLRWHAPGGKDVTLFEGLSLGGLWRYNLLMLPVMTMFRQAALGVPADSPHLLDNGMAEKYRPVRVAAGRTRRTDLKALGFRFLHRGLRALGPRADRRSVLVMGSPSNRSLWRGWLERRDGFRFALDFPLAQPPGLALALRAVAGGARVFDPVPAALTPAARAGLDRVRAAVEELPHRPDWRALFDFNGVSLSEVFVARVLRPFLEELESLVAKRAAFAAEFDELKPSLLLLPQEVSADALILIHLARSRSVPFWFLNHGFPGAGYRFDQAAHCGDLGADKILAWGPGDRDNYLRAGVDANRIVIAGNPAFDAFLPARAPRPFRGARGATILVVAQTNLADIGAVYFDDSIERFFAETIGLLDRLGAARVIYKLHPGPSRVEFYEGLKRRMKVSCEIELSQEEGFRSVLERSDCVVGPASTCIFETLLAGKDYFFFNNDPVQSPAPFELKNSYVAKTVEELEKNLLRNDPVPRETILREFCGLNGGEDSRHATRNILGMIGRELGA